MEEVNIRTAFLDDLGILLDFEQNIVKTERPFDITIQDKEIHYYDIAKMIRAPDVEVMVAEYGSEIIGSGYARIEVSKVFLKHPKHAYLGFMYVKPEHRGKGINKRIIEALQHWAIDRGITEFRLDVYNDNLPAIKAYQKIGFVKLMIEMRMKLPDGK